MKKLILAVALIITSINAQADTKNQIPTEAEFEDILYNHPDKKHISFDIDDGCNRLGCGATMNDAINITKKGKIVTFIYRFSYFQWPENTKLKGTEDPEVQNIDKLQFDCKKQSVRTWHDAGWVVKVYQDSPDIEKEEKVYEEAYWEDWVKFHDHKGLTQLFKQLCK